MVMGGQAALITSHSSLILRAGALGGTNATKVKREIGGMQRNCHVELAARSAGNFW